MAAVLNMYNGGMMTSRDDAVVYEPMLAGNGILNSGTITWTGSNQIHFDMMDGVIKGRKFTIPEQLFNVQLPEADGMPGRLFLRMDLSDSQEPLKIMSVCQENLSDLEQDENCNYNNGVYEIELATYTANKTTLTDFVVTAMNISGSIKEIKTKISEIDSSLNGKVSGFSANNYKAVTGLAYDATNNKIGLKVGADTVIPFSSGASEFAYFIMHLASQANDGFIYCNDTFNSLSNNSNTIVSNEYIGERIRYSRINSQQAGFYAVTNGKYGRKDQTHKTFEIIDANAGDLLGTATGSNHEIIVIAL